MSTFKNNILIVRIAIKLLNNPMICCFYYAVDASTMVFRLTITMLSSHELSRLSLALYVYDYVIFFMRDMLSESHSKLA